MKYHVTLITILVMSSTFWVSCTKKDVNTPNTTEKKKEFKTSFEFVNDFDGFYITPQGHKNTTFHELTAYNVHSGSYVHRAWVNGSNSPTTQTSNNNHRGYPTIQFQNSDLGTFKTPCYVTFWVWLDMELNESTNGGTDDWFSFATFTDDETDLWNRTVLINLSHDGFVHLGHVPKQGFQNHIFQTNSIQFPQKEWVELKVYLDFSNNGYAKVWQNGQLVSHANVENMENILAQAHFGMYCPPQIETGVIYNDDLTIIEVDQE